jgi:hypothetical protein
MATRDRDRLRIAHARHTQPQPERDRVDIAHDCGLIEADPALILAAWFATEKGFT